MWTGGEMVGEGRGNMSTSITFTIAGQEAEKLKSLIREKATQEGMSVSEWIVQACAEYLRGK